MPVNFSHSQTKKAVEKGPSASGKRETKSTRFWGEKIASEPQQGNDEISSNTR